MRSDASMIVAPTLLLDIDDVLCLSAPYGGRHAQRAVHQPERAPADLWQKLFHTEAVQALNELMEECQPRVVITSSWLSILDRPHFIEIFKKTGLEQVAVLLHEHWDAPRDLGVSRHDAIDNWLKQHHCGEPFLILDDFQSGESLVDCMWHEAGNVVLCHVDGGFNRGLLTVAKRALQNPFRKPEWW